MHDIKLENRIRKLSRREFLKKGSQGVIIYPLLNEPFLKAIDWVYKWAYPKEKKFSLLFVDNHGFREYLLYEIRAPYKSSFGRWYDNEIEWFKGKSQPLELGKKIFTYLNKTAHNVDPFKLNEGDKVRVADLNEDGRVMGRLITDLMAQGKARRISADAIMGMNSKLYWENYHKQKKIKKEVF